MIGCAQERVARCRPVVIAWLASKPSEGMVIRAGEREGTI